MVDTDPKHKPIRRPPVRLPYHDDFMFHGLGTGAVVEHREGRAIVENHAGRK